MEVIIRTSPEEAAELTSRLLAARLRAKPGLVLGLATGRTMERVYERLVAKHGRLGSRRTGRPARRLSLFWFGYRAGRKTGCAS